MVDRRAVEAGLLYCAVVLAAGFVLGAMRVVWVAPLAGELAGVALEAPVMLAVSWSACGWTMERLDISDRFLDRLVMGAVALAPLLAAEAAISMLAQGRSLPDYLSHSPHAAVLLGLLVQVAFAVFPILRRRALERGTDGEEF